MDYTDSNLLNQKIVKLEIDADDQHTLKFTTENGNTIYWDTYGDCCSETWFYHVLGVENLLNATVKEVQYIDLFGEDAKQNAVNNDKLGRQDFDRLYCCKLITDRGYVDIEFRNSSNGYYGGDLSEFSDASESLYPRDCEWTNLTADYTYNLPADMESYSDHYR